MIGHLRGRLQYRGTDHIVIDVQGVGYMVYCSDRTLATLPGPGEAVALYTDLLVREDLLQLFGFPDLIEKEWHRLLMSVQGIGAKASLSILGALGADGVGRAIALGDWKSVTVAKGVGQKTAQRVVLDLKDKAPGIMAMGGTLTGAIEGPDAVVEADPLPAAKSPSKPAPAMSAQADALSALSNLGYSPSDAAGAVAEASGAAPDASEAELIRAALKLLAPKG